MCAICQLPANHELERIIIANYIDPGSGQAIQSFLPALLGFFSALFASLGFFLRRFFRNMFQKKFLFFLLLLIFLAGIIGAMAKLSPKVQKNSFEKRVIVLAFDGLDPTLLEEGMGKNLLPNFQKLQQTGYYSKLETTTPPQSPVAWASFATGASPAKHGIYDFITRNPKNYKLDLTFSSNTQWKTTPFWEETGKSNIPTTILFLPNTYPPSNFRGKMLSGMGVADLLGTLGTLTLITTEDYSQKKNFRGNIIAIRNGSSIKTALEGPKYKTLNETKVATLPLEITKDGKEKIIIKLQNKEVILKEKEFSDWIKIEFNIDFLTRVPGMIQFYSKSIQDNKLELYVSPINIDPENPYKPISQPREYAAELAKEYGLFSTLGLPHDTWALDQGIFNEDAFLRQADEIVSKREEMYFGELEKFTGGLFFGYFGMTDSISHMFWRYLQGDKTQYQQAIMDSYQKADEIVGETRRIMRKDDILIILSDHGFKSFDYEINLNTWLHNNGYLVLKDNKTQGGELFEDVDWLKTKAYAVGYNGIYLNLKDREGEGIVEKNDVPSLEKEITAKLLELKNPYTNSAIVKRIYTKTDLEISESDEKAPDLFIGFYQGTRSSWDSAVGAVDTTVVSKRESKWSGDHLFDASEVPGVLLMNRKINFQNPRIIDVAPIILNLLDDIEVTKE